MADTRVASVADTAVDIEGMGRTAAIEYARYRRPEDLKVKPGKRVTYFTLRRIPTSLYMRFVMDGPSLYERCRRAFMVGVVQVENLHDADGRVRTVFAPTHEADTAGGKLKVFGEEEVDLIPPVFVEDIGNLVMNRSALDPKGEAPSALLDLSLLVFAQRVSPPVDANQDSAPPSSDELADSPPPKSGDGGAGRTSADATAKATASSAGSRTGSLTKSSTPSSKRPGKGRTPARGKRTQTRGRSKS